jgi:hypothetical protein
LVSAGVLQRRWVLSLGYPYILAVLPLLSNFLESNVFIRLICYQCDFGKIFGAETISVFPLITIFVSLVNVYEIQLDYFAFHCFGFYLNTCGDWATLKSLFWFTHFGILLKS